MCLSDIRAANRASASNAAFTSTAYHVVNVPLVVDLNGFRVSNAGNSPLNAATAPVSSISSSVRRVRDSAELRRPPTPASRSSQSATASALA